MYNIKAVTTGDNLYNAKCQTSSDAEFMFRCLIHRTFIKYVELFDDRWQSLQVWQHPDWK